MDEPKPVACWLTDMDGVLVHEETAIPGAREFIEALVDSGRRFLVLTNNSIFTRVTCAPGCRRAASTYQSRASGRPPSPPRSSSTTSAHKGPLTSSARRA